MLLIQLVVWIFFSCMHVLLCQLDDKGAHAKLLLALFTRILLYVVYFLN